MLRRDFSGDRKARIKRVLRAHRIRSTNPDQATVDAVVARQDGRCVRCGEVLKGERGFDWSVHHRRGRDGKPDSHSRQNLLAVCGADNVSGCHGWIHQHRGAAMVNGWWLSRIAGTDPLTVAVLVDRASRWVYLTTDGGYADEPPEKSVA